MQERFNLMRACHFRSWDETERVPVEYRHYLFELEREHRKREKEELEKARREAKKRRAK